MVSLRFSQAALLKRAAALPLVMVLCLHHIASAANYYVSKSGSDLNSGMSTNQAFLTIQKAASLMNAGDTCYILSGIYRETVTPAHSGNAVAPITFTAYPGATPIVSGAEILSLSWSVYSGSIYQASTTSNFRQLFVDGRMMNEARWPNAAVDDLLHAPRANPDSCTYTNLVDASLPNVNLLGATLHIFPNEYNNPGYAANTRQITGWDSTARKISWNNNIFNTGAMNTFYYVYGALSLIDIPTEWYLNTGSGILYLWTPDSASPSAHVIEIKARASAFTLDTRSYVVVSGINVFAAGISMANTTNCVVDNCNLTYVQHNTTADWTVSVPIANQVSGSGSTWKNSTINYSSQDGIRCTGQNEVVSNCVILNVDYYPGTYYASVTAFSGGTGTKIVNNTFWYSGRYLVGASSPSADISYNDLGYGDLLTSDGGATYVYVGGGDGAGTAIHHNWVHHNWAGIYVDAFQNNYFVYRNVCWSNYLGMLFNQFTNNLIINNTTISNTSADIQFNGSSDTGVQLINNFWRRTQNNYWSTVVSNNGFFAPLGTNYVPQTGSGAINGGMIYSPYTDGYSGSAPDIGAYEVGGDYWIPGANFSPRPFPNPYALPFITAQPGSQTNYIGQTAMFSVSVTSALPFSYQWRSGASGSGVYTNLIAGGQFSAVTNASLYVTNLTLANAADFVVVLTNSNGAVTSSVATLTVLDAAPSIAMQPASQTNVAGQTATFGVDAVGLPPLFYQWLASPVGQATYTNLSEGGSFSGVTNVSLTIANVTPLNALDYIVVVTNSSGSVTSAVARLTVLTNSAYQQTILADHPVSYWPLNETNGTLIHDVVATNNGTCINPSGLTLGGPGILYSQGVTTDTAIYFTNTSSGYIKIPYSTTLNTPRFTIEAWLNMPVFPATGAGVDMNPLSFDDSNPKGWAFEIPNPNTSSPNMYGWLGVSNTWTQINSGTCIQGQWSYYALTYDGTTFTIYTNGVAAGSKASGYTQVSTLHSLYLGAYDSGGTVTRFYRGGMQNVAFYSNALSAAQILNHYQVGSTGHPPAPPNVLLYRLRSNLAVSWTSGFLQAAGSLSGPWGYVTNAISPYTVGPTNPALFFRATLEAPP
jgi:hypothetical protein